MQDVNGQALSAGEAKNEISNDSPNMVHSHLSHLLTYATRNRYLSISPLDPEIKEAQKKWNQDKVRAIRESGAKRTPVQTWTRAARRRFLNWLNRLDYRQIPIERCLFLTLTFPSHPLENRKEPKRRLNRFLKKVEKAEGQSMGDRTGKQKWVGAIWKMEGHKSHRWPHFHIILFFPDPLPTRDMYARIDRYIGQWARINKAEDDLAFLEHGLVGSPLVHGRAFIYAMMYLIKPIESLMAFGNFTGVRNQSLFPMSPTVTKRITAEEAKQLVDGACRHLGWQVPDHEGPFTCYLPVPARESLIRNILSSELYAVKKVSTSWTSLSHYITSLDTNSAHSNLGYNGTFDISND